MNWKEALRTISWHLTSRMNRLDWQHAAAMGLVALWAMLVGLIDVPLFAETQNMSVRLASYRSLDIAKARPAVQASTPRDVATDFAATLPELEEYTEQLRALHALADKTGIFIMRIGYRYEPMPAMPITKLALQMDVRGDEVQQRRFLQAALNTFPNLSIARLAYAKSAEATGTFEQTLHVNLYYASRRKTAA